MIGISEGIVLADRYQLVRRQFERGIGAGWVAVDTESSSEVWVQFTRHGGLEAVGELLRRHGHAGMPAVLDTGELRMIVDSSALALRAVGEAHATHVEIVIEFVVCRPITGRAMSAKVARRPLTPPEALTAVAGLAEALELALGEGYSHGWLTGESVWLTRRGACALDLALGLCAADGLAIDVDQEVTGCFAPERLNGGYASEAADVFALGWLLYTLLIGYAELQTEYARVVAEAGAATTLELLAMWRKRARLHVVELLGAESELALLLIAALSERAEDRPALGAFHPGARSAARGLAGAAPLIVPVPTARHKGRTEAELAAAGLAVAGLTAAGVVEALHSEGTSAGGTAGTESLADSGYGSGGVNGSEVAAGAGLGAGAATGSAGGADVASGASAGTQTVAEAGAGSGSETLALATAAGAGALVGAGVAEAIGGAASGSGAIGAGSGAGAGSGYTTASFGQTGLSPSGSGSSGSGSGSGSGGSGSGGSGSGSAAAGSGSGSGGAGSGTGAAASGGSGGAAGYGASASETGTLTETESAESAARWRRKVLATSSASVVGALVVGVIVGYLWGHSSSKTTTVAAAPATVTVTVTVTVPVTVPAGSGAGAGATPAAGATTAPGALATTAAAGSGATATPSAGGAGGSGGTPVATSGGSAGGPAPTSPAQAFSQLTQEVQTGKSAGQISASTASSLLGAIGAAKSESQGSTSYYTKVRSLGSLIQSGQQSGAIPESLAGQLNGLVNYLYAGGGS